MANLFCQRQKRELQGAHTGAVLVIGNACTEKFSHKAMDCGIIRPCLDVVVFTSIHMCLGGLEWNLN